jgi:hypothetical protein
VPIAHSEERLKVRVCETVATESATATLTHTNVAWAVSEQRSSTNYPSRWRVLRMAAYSTRSRFRQRAKPPLRSRKGSLGTASPKNGRPCAAR